MRLPNSNPTVRLHLVRFYRGETARLVETRVRSHQNGSSIVDEYPSDLTSRTSDTAAKRFAAAVVYSGAQAEDLWAAYN